MDSIVFVGTVVMGLVVIAGVGLVVKAGEGLVVLPPNAEPDVEC